MEQVKQGEGLVPLRLVEGRLCWYPPGAGDQPRPLSDPASREDLAAVAVKYRDRLCFAAPGSDIRLLHLQLSPDEKKHITQALPFLLEEQLAQDVEQMHFASRATGKLTLSVAICSHARMQDWQEQLRDIPVLRRWVPEPLLLPWREGEWCLVIESGEAIFRYGDSEGCSIETSLLPTLLQQCLAEHSEPDTVVLYGADQAADTAHVPTALRSKVQWRRGSLGSALLLSSPDQERLNLLQGEYAPRLPLGRWWTQWRSVAAVFAAAFALQLLATWAEYRSLSQENLRLRTAIQDSYRQVNPRGAAPEPEKQLLRQLASLKGSGQVSGFTSLVERVGAVIAQRPGTTIASINYNDRGGEMRMNILAADFEAVESIRQGINAAGLRAEMESSNAQGDQVRARIRVGERS